MRAFIAIVIKDLRVRFSSPTELVFFILLPLVFTVVLSGASIAGAGKGKAEQPAPLVLVQDGVGSIESRAFTTMIRAMPDVRIRLVSDPTALISTSEPDLLLSLSASAAPGRGLPFTLTFKLSPWRGTAAGTAKRVGDWLLAVQSGRGGGAAPAAAPAAGQAARPAAAPAGVGAAVSATAADGPSSAATSNAGQIITWALVPLLGLGAGFIGERGRGTMRRIYTTPAPRAAIAAASVAAEMLGAFVQISLLIVFGTVVLGLQWLSHPLELAGLVVSFCLAGASLGVLLGSLCRTSRQAGALALALSMVLAVFGGCWYPSAFFPAALRSVTRLDPAGWAMDGFLAALSPSAGAGAAVQSAALLLGFSLVVLLLAAAASRGRRATIA